MRLTNSPGSTILFQRSERSLCQPVLPGLMFQVIRPSDQQPQLGKRTPSLQNPLETTEERQQMSRQNNDKNLQILKTLLREPSNSHCADCKTSSHPRWASWNLGIFVCIRCSGIHRSLGTHISRVKSVDLDTWTDEQVKSMVLWGNAKANQYWEYGLSENYIPDGSKLENFIRTKYEIKKWVSGPVPDPQRLQGAPQTHVHQQPKQAQPAPQLQHQSVQSRPQPKALSSSQLLDLEFGSPIAAPKAQSQSHSHSHSQSQSQVQSQSQTRAALDSRPELKKSILSLYSSPMATRSAPMFTQGYSQNESASSLNSTNSTNTMSLNNSNINIGSVNSGNQWNAWSTQTTQTTTPKPLDDDLFKNVWN